MAGFETATPFVHWLPWHRTAEPWIFVCGCSVCAIDKLVPSVFYLTFSLLCEAAPSQQAYTYSCVGAVFCMHESVSLAARACYAAWLGLHRLVVVRALGCPLGMLQLPALCMVAAGGDIVHQFGWFVAGCMCVRAPAGAS